MDDRTEIVDVWANNLEEEFERIRDVVENHPYVAIDTEFPGIVARPTGNVLDYNYQTIKCNVDLLKVIQLGVTFSNGKGELPKISTWQFNFKFDLDCDMYAQNSIDFLKCSGINFEKHQSLGIELLHFGEVIMSSGLVMNEDVKWISFHGCYDFAYLLKILTCSALPQNETAFFDLLNDFFPSLYDIKYLLLNLNIKQLSRTFSLQKISEILSVKRIGRQHQAGSDSLVTCKTFFKLMELYFDNKIDDKKYSGIIYGLGPTIKNYQHKDKEEHDAKYRYSNSFKKNLYWNRNNGGLALQNNNSIMGTNNDNTNNNNKSNKSNNNNNNNNNNNGNNENNDESKEDNQTDTNNETNNNNDHSNNNNDNNNNNDDNNNNNNNNNGNSSNNSNNNSSNNNGNSSTNNNDSSNNNNNGNNNNSSSGNNSSEHYEKYERGNNAHYEKCIVENGRKNITDVNKNRGEGGTKKKENKQLQKYKRMGIYNNSINQKAINPHYVEAMAHNKNHSNNNNSSNNNNNMRQNYPTEGNINTMNSVSKEENIHGNVSNKASKHNSNIKNVNQQSAQQCIIENSSSTKTGKEMNIKNEKGKEQNAVKNVSQCNHTKIMTSNGSEILNGKTKDVIVDKGEKTAHSSTLSHFTGSKNITEVGKLTKLNQVPTTDISGRVSSMVSGKKHVGCNILSMNDNSRNGRNSHLNANIIEKVTDAMDMNNNKTVHSMECTNETSNEMDTQEIDDTTGLLQKKEDPMTVSQRNNVNSSLDINEMNTTSERSVSNMNELNNGSNNNNNNNNNNHNSNKSNNVYQHNYNKGQQEGMINNHMFNNSSNGNFTNCNNTGGHPFVRNLNYGSFKMDTRSKSSVHTMNGKSAAVYHYTNGNKMNNISNTNLNHMNYANEMSKVHVSNNGVYGTNDTDEIDMKKNGTENVAFTNYITKCKNHKNNWIKAGNKFENYRNNLNSNYKNQFKKALSTLSNDHMYQWSSNCNRTMFMNSNQWSGININATKNTVQNTSSISESTKVLHKNSDRDPYDKVCTSPDKSGISQVSESRNEKEIVKNSGFINSATSTGSNLSVAGVCSSTMLDSNETNLTKLTSSLHSNEHISTSHVKSNLNTSTTLGNSNNQYNSNTKLSCTGTETYGSNTINNSLESMEGNNTAASTVEGNEKRNTSNKHNKKVTMIKKYSLSSKGSSSLSSSSPSCANTTITTINNSNNSTVNENRMKHGKEQDQKRGSSVNGTSNPATLNKEQNENSSINMSGNIIVTKNKRGNNGRGNRNNTSNVAVRNVKGSVSHYYNVPNQKKGNGKNHNNYYANTIEENVHISSGPTKIHEKNYKTNSGIGYMDRSQYNMNYGGNINYGKPNNKMYRTYGKNFTPVLMKSGNTQSSASNSGTVHNGINCNVSSTTIDNDNEYIGNEGAIGNTVCNSVAMETVPTMSSRDINTNTLHMYNMNLEKGTTDISVNNIETNAESVNHSMEKTIERMKNSSSPMGNNCNKSMKYMNKYQNDLNSYNRNNMTLGPHNFRNKSRMSEHVSNINNSNKSNIGNYMNMSTYSIHSTNFSDPINNINLLNSNYATTVHNSNSHLTNDGHDNSSTTYMDPTNNNHLYSGKIEGMECTMNYNAEPICEDQNQQNVHEAENNKYNYVNYDF